MLRAQVQRLQMELREYRKRLSLNSTGLSRPSPVAGGFSSLFVGGATTNFQFEFPKFGGLPGSHVFDNGPLSKAATKPSTASPVSAATSRHNSTGRSLSPREQVNGSGASSPEKTLTPAKGTSRSGSLNNVTNGVAASIGNPTRSSTADSSSGQSRVFQFNSGSSTHSDSPSASSNSVVGQSSSCDTSPEPSHNSPSNPLDTVADGYVCHGNSEGEVTFCEKLNMACGNPRNPIPRAMSQSDTNSPAAPAKTTPVPDVNGIDIFANQNGGQFDPTLFGDYRDSQAAIVGDGDFTGGFFNDAFPMADFGSPFHFGDTPAVQKPNPLDEIERQQDGEEEVVPGEDVTQMLNCHKIWLVSSIAALRWRSFSLTLSRDKLSHRTDFKDGTIDIDNLCSELRAKARCSESGVVVDTKDVEAALQRLPEQQK